MTLSNTVIDRLDWIGIGTQLDVEGYAMLPGLLHTDSIKELVYKAQAMNGKQNVSPHLASLGGADLLYFNAPLPTPLTSWRVNFYKYLAVIANRWNETLGIDRHYPAELEDFLQYNREAGQTQEQSHLNRLGVENYVPLHQINGSKYVFPMQIVALLSEPGTDFHGGEFIMTEQRPRMQSRPMVLPLKRGDAAIITTAERPFNGTSGHYRVNLKHAISRVRKGERLGLELSFHHA